ncbi:FAD-dependent oxidoreductase [Pseudidiomarina sp.]|uniref:FAD-dependent oxidoreductase n=1 Tax=Pseudidiomarina sp. TaxID=2081707 RepID=UPI003A96EE6A
MQIVVIGGGMVGASAALAFAQSGHDVTVIEAGKPATSTGDWDLRISSIHQRNVAWLTELGVWADVRPERRFYYTDLAVECRDGMRVNFAASEVNVEALGAMVENNALQQALWQHLDQHGVRCLSLTRVAQFQLAEQQVELDTGERLPYDLLVGADGSTSQVAKAAGIAMRGWDYDMRCLLAIADVREPIQPATWEVFREAGPFALLPLGTHQACLIDYRSEQEWQQLSGDAQVHKALHETFAPHIGDHKVSRFASFPLRRQRALRYHVHNSVVLIGDAAHSIHPLAGQGVNIGFADVQELLSQLNDQQPVAAALRAYERVRERENQQMMRAMDAIHFGFRSQHVVPRALISGGLALVNRVMPLKRALIKQAIGMK